MAMHPNETLARQFYTAFNNRKFDEAAKLVSDKFEWRDAATGEVYRGPSGMRQYMEYWVKSFNDAKLDVQQIYAADRFFAAEFIGRGTHTGTLETPGGSIPATNRKIELPCCEVGTIENGKFLAGATYYDTASILHQLGVTEMVATHR